MAQKSLPRLNRINVSMFWENFNPYNNRGGLGLKIYIFLRHFSRFFLKYNIFYFKKFWKKDKKWKQTLINNHFLSKKCFNFDFKVEYDLIPFNIYIYSVFNKNYLLYIHGLMESIEPKNNKANIVLKIQKTYFTI